MGSHAVRKTVTADADERGRDGVDVIGVVMVLLGNLWRWREDAK